MSTVTQAVQYEGIAGLIPPQEFCVHNATDDPVEMRYDGETRVIPAFHAVAKEDPRYPEVCHSLRGEDGEYIKGTLLITDILRQRTTSEGVDDGRWSAAAAIMHCLGIDVRGKMAYGTLALKGVSFIPAGATKADIARIADAGRKRYVLWYENNAAQIVSAFDERNASRQKMGHGPLPADKSVRIAMGVMEAARKRDGVQADRVVAELTHIMADDIEPAVDEEQALRAAALRVVGQVKEEENYLGPSELLVNRLLQDPVAMSMLRRMERTKMVKGRQKEAEEELPAPGAGVPTSGPQ